MHVKRLALYESQAGPWYLFSFLGICRGDEMPEGSVKNYASSFSMAQPLTHPGNPSSTKMPPERYLLLLHHARQFGSGPCCLRTKTLHCPTGFWPHSPPSLATPNLSTLIFSVVSIPLTLSHRFPSSVCLSSLSISVLAYSTYSHSSFKTAQRPPPPRRLPCPCPPPSPRPGKGPPQGPWHSSLPYSIVTAH